MGWTQRQTITIAMNNSFFSHFQHTKYRWGVSRIARGPWENQGNRVILSHSSSLSAHFTQESPSSHKPHLIAAQPYRFQSPGFQTKHERSIYKNRIINTKRKHRESSKLLLRPELHKQTLHNSLVAGAPSLCLK